MYTSYEVSNASLQQCIFPLPGLLQEQLGLVLFEDIYQLVDVGCGCVL